MVAVRGREVPFNSVRLSFLSCISEESESACKDSLKVYTCSSGSPRTSEDVSSEMEEMKVRSYVLLLPPSRVRSKHN